MNQSDLPLWESMSHYKHSDRVWLHVPGHGGGPGLPPGSEFVLGNLASVDLTELSGLDDLHHPTGAIARAQALAAGVWQADQSYFLVNGSSAGVLAMITATCGPGDVVLAPRNAHGSFYHALILSGAVPRYLPVPEKDGVPYNVTVESVREAFRSTPEAKAIFITSPSYYGICADLTEIAEISRRHDALVLLDEAHGAHLGFSSNLPPSLGSLADLRVQSWHKTLGALTPGAVLHRHGTNVDEARLRTVLQWVQTSSPSYPLLLSLDAARRQMALEGRRIADSMAEAALELRLAVSRRLPVLADTDAAEYGCTLDYTKVTVLTGKAAISGLTASVALSGRGIDVELAQPGHLLALVGPGYNRGKTPDVARALLSLPENSHAAVTLPPLPLPEVVLPPRQAFYGTVRKVLPAGAAGCISAGTVTAYPPGIPVLAPGERITWDVILYLEESSRAGVTFRGLDHGALRIYADEV